MRRKGFTLVELLVVISIIALLMGMLMPALAMVRQIAQRMICGSSLAGVGKAMLVYASDNEEDFPVAGMERAIWSKTGTIAAWDALLARNAYGGTAGTTRYNPVTVTSSLFLLVKYSDVTPRQFLCKGDKNSNEFKLPATTAITEMTLAWDFGETPGKCCSFSYQMPYWNDVENEPGYPILETSSDDTILCADRNPQLDNNATRPHDGGQNVMYKDTHVVFEKSDNVGPMGDNIWNWGGNEAQIGVGVPVSENDAYLVNEMN